MSKYKELPAFETNEFKVGDLVRVYQYMDGNHYYDTHIAYKDDYNFDVWHLKKGFEKHFKALRKLVEIKPRVIWVNENTVCVPIYGDFTVCRENITRISYTEIKGWTKVVEVLEDTNE